MREEAKVLERLSQVMAKEFTRSMSMAYLRQGMHTAKDMLLSKDYTSEEIVEVIDCALGYDKRNQDRAVEAVFAEFALLLKEKREKDSC